MTIDEIEQWLKTIKETERSSVYAYELLGDDFPLQVIARVEAMLPVVKAAIAWRHEFRGTLYTFPPPIFLSDTELIRAIDEFEGGGSNGQ